MSVYFHFPFWWSRGVKIDQIKNNLCKLRKRKNSLFILFFSYFWFKSILIFGGVFLSKFGFFLSSTLNSNLKLKIILINYIGKQGGCIYNYVSKRIEIENWKLIFMKYADEVCVCEWILWKKKWKLTTKFVWDQSRVYI